MEETSSPANLVSLYKELGISPALVGAGGHRPCIEANVTVVADHDPDDGKEIRLIPPAAKAWRRMRAAAAADGVTLWPCSGFRSYAYQADLIRRKLAAGESLDDALEILAPPGCSEHHTGRAIDIATPESERLGEDFADTPACAWLRAHAADYGFSMSYPRDNPQGFAYEPWHWCWEGEG